MDSSHVENSQPQPSVELLRPLDRPVGWAPCLREDNEGIRAYKPSWTNGRPGPPKTRTRTKRSGEKPCFTSTLKTDRLGFSVPSLRERVPSWVNENAIRKYVRALSFSWTSLESNNHRVVPQHAHYRDGTQGLVSPALAGIMKKDPPSTPGIPEIWHLYNRKHMSPPVTQLRVFEGDLMWRMPFKLLQSLVLAIDE